MLRSLFYSIINAIIPPRPHEAVVASLTRDYLERIRHHDSLPYHDPRVTALIWEVKYRANTKALKLAGEFLGDELLAVVEEEVGVPVVIPVPMHQERRKERGHNQTELLCEAALTFVKGSYEYAPHALERVTHTTPQQTLTRRKRLINVQYSMKVVDQEKIKGRVCVVVDDVSTTGSTLAEAERALLTAGARKVYKISLARS